MTDAADVWRLIARAGGLERNTAYAYLLLCSHFAETSLVAERAGDLVGFVMAYRPPSRPEEVFVWQVAVAPEMRGCRLGARLLDTLIEQPACADATFLTATVTRDNAPSRGLFHGFARRHGTTCEVGSGFAAELFPERHDAEELLRIGPLSRTKEGA